MHIVRESIFVSAIRSFFNALLAVLGVIIAFVIVMVIAGALSSPYQMDDDSLDMRALPDTNGNNAILPETVPVVLQVDISGIIGMDKLRGSTIETFLRASRKGVLKRDRVKAVLLYIDSGGGTAVDSDLIYQAILRYKKEFNVPVYAYTPSVCASGSYMIACAADKIYASAPAIIGSVGVKWGLGFNFWQFMQTHGIDSVTLTAGMDKEKYPSFTKADPAGYQDLQAIIAASYVQFVDLVSASRESHGLTAQALRSNYGARVFISETAQKYGYIDQANSNYIEALGDLVKAAGMDTNPYQVIQFSYKQSAIQDLFSSKLSLWLEETKQALLGLKAEGRLNNKLLYYYEPQD